MSTVSEANHETLTSATDVCVVNYGEATIEAKREKNPYESSVTEAINVERPATYTRASAIGPLLAIAPLTAACAYVGWELGHWLLYVGVIAGLLAASVVLWSVR